MESLHSHDDLDYSVKLPALIYRQYLVGYKGITPGLRFNQFSVLNWGNVRRLSGGLFTTKTKNE